MSQWAEPSGLYAKLTSSLFPPPFPPLPTQPATISAQVVEIFSSFVEFPSWPADFKFLFISFSPRRHKCIPIYERSQYRSWARARLCWPSNKRFIDIRWSDQGKITGMGCTKITQENGRIQRNGWDDNFLCARNVPYT